jgi:chromosome segregation ATPase
MPTIFSRFSVYGAAVVIGISWLISNTFVTVLEEDTQTMDAVQSEQTQAQQFSNISEGQRALLKKIADIEDTLDKQRSEGKQTAEQNDGDEPDADQKWVESFKSDSDQLVETAEELEELAKRVKPSADLNQAIESSIQRAKAFAAEVQKQANAYEQEMESGQSLDAGQDEANAESRKKHDEQINAAVAGISKMEEPLEKLNEEIVSLYDKMDSYVTERREHSDKHATVAGWIAYLFYALGTAIGGLGKWLENKQVRSPAAT